MNIIKSLLSELGYFWKSFIDNLPEWFVTICLAACSGILALTVEPKRRIELFDDFTERYPYSGETIGIPIVACLIIILPCVVMGLLAIFYPRKTDLNLAYMSLAQSICLTLLVTEALKVTVARPRPNFFSYCQYSKDSGKCTGPSKHKKDARQSFPSGHASLSFAAGTWMVLYLTNFNPKSELWWILIRLVPIYLAIFIATTRITDYMHHVSDVISGAVLGAGLSGYIFNAQNSRIFMLNRKRDDDEDYLLESSQ